VILAEKAIPGNNSIHEKTEIGRAETGRRMTDDGRFSNADMLTSQNQKLIF
jgi:hypothetical protein